MRRGRGDVVFRLHHDCDPVPGIARCDAKHWASPTDPWAASRQSVESRAVSCGQAVRGCAGGPGKTRVLGGRHTVGWHSFPAVPWPPNASKGDDRHGEVGFAMQHRVWHAEELGVRAPPSQGLRRAARYVVRGGVRVSGGRRSVGPVDAGGIEVQRRHRQSTLLFHGRPNQDGGWVDGRFQTGTCAHRDDDCLHRNKHEPTLGRSTADSPFRDPRDYRPLNCRSCQWPAAAACSCTPFASAHPSRPGSP